MNLIKKIREDKKITQGELSAKLKITQSALSQLEMKDKAPSMNTFLMLVKLGYITEETIYGIVKELIKKQWRK